jgi:hypothetical protein
LSTSGWGTTRRRMSGRSSTGSAPSGRAGEPGGPFTAPPLPQPYSGKTDVTIINACNSGWPERALNPDRYSGEKKITKISAAQGPLSRSASPSFS